MDFVKIKPDGMTDRDLLIALADGQAKTHECIHGFQSETRSALGELKAQQDVDGARITKLAQLFGAEKVAPGEAKPKGRGIGTWGFWKAAGSGTGVITCAALIYQFLVAIAPGAHAFLMGLK